MDYHELKRKSVAELREVAEKLEGLTGYTQMNKPHLLEAICKHQGIPMHDHHEVVGIDKTAVKSQIRALKQERDQALAARDRAKLKRSLRAIHRLKRRLRRAAI
jgi:hypothetical protein